MALTWSLGQFWPCLGLQGEGGDLRSRFLRPFRRAAGSSPLRLPQRQDTAQQGSRNSRPLPARGGGLAGRTPPHRQAGRASQQPRETSGEAAGGVRCSSDPGVRGPGPWVRPRPREGGPARPPRLERYRPPVPMATRRSVCVPRAPLEAPPSSSAVQSSTRTGGRLSSCWTTLTLINASGAQRAREASSARRRSHRQHRLHPCRVSIG